MRDWADVIFTGQLFLAIAFINLYARNVLSAVNYLLQFLCFYTAFSDCGPTEALTISDAGARGAGPSRQASLLV